MAANHTGTILRFSTFLLYFNIFQIALHQFYLNFLKINTFKGYLDIGQKNTIKISAATFASHKYHKETL